MTPDTDRNEAAQMKFISDTMLAQLARQEAAVDELRTRSNLILASAGVIMAVLTATQPVNHQYLLIIPVLLFLVGGATIGSIFFARKHWSFTMNGNVMLRMTAKTPPYTDVEFYDQLARQGQAYWEKNKKRIDKMAIRLNVGLACLGCSIAAWMAVTVLK